MEDEKTRITISVWIGRAYKAKATKSSEIKELTVIFKPLLSASYVEQVATKLRGLLHTDAQPR